MSGTDAVAFAFAVAAVVVGLGLTVYVVLSDGRPTDVDERTLHAPTMDLMLRRTGGASRWRFESRTDETITVDVFSQRASGGTATAAWQHELMAEPLTLAPGTTAELRAEPGATRYDAAVGWYLGEAAERRRESRFVTVDTAGS